MEISLTPWADKGLLNVIIETPKGSRNKYAFEPELGLFRLKGALPLGNSFPFDFGFIPGTLSDDGDPLDVLVLMDEPAFTGCWLHCRCIGAITARQKEKKGKAKRNDRLIAVFERSLMFGAVKTLSDLDPQLLENIKSFFVSYNERKGKRFDILGSVKPKNAEKLVKAAEKMHLKNR